MSLLLRSGAAAFAATAIFALADAARATCIVPTASYQGGAYGAYAVTEYDCSVLQQDGGSEIHDGFRARLRCFRRRLAVVVIDGRSRDRRSHHLFGSRHCIGVDMGFLHLYRLAGGRGDDHGHTQLSGNIDRIVLCDRLP